MCCLALVLSDGSWPGLHWGCGSGGSGEREWMERCANQRQCHRPALDAVDQWQHPYSAQHSTSWGTWQSS